MRRILAGAREGLLRDRRVFRESQKGKPWWLMRSYVSVEKFLGGSSF